jgi:hypothetical protein
MMALKQVLIDFVPLVMMKNLNHYYSVREVVFRCFIENVLNMKALITNSNAVNVNQVLILKLFVRIIFFSQLNFKNLLYKENTNVLFARKWRTTRIWKPRNAMRVNAANFIT